MSQSIRSPTNPIQKKRDRDQDCNAQNTERSGRSPRRFSAQRHHADPNIGGKNNAVETHEEPVHQIAAQHRQFQLPNAEPHLLPDGENGRPHEKSGNYPENKIAPARFGQRPYVCRKSKTSLRGDVCRHPGDQQRSAKRTKFILRVFIQGKIAGVQQGQDNHRQEHNAESNRKRQLAHHWRSLLASTMKGHIQVRTQKKSKDAHRRQARE